MAILRQSLLLIASWLWLCAPGAAASLFDRPSTTLYSGAAAYSLDIANGEAFAVGVTLDGLLDLNASGFFDPGTAGQNPFGASLLLTALADFEVVVSAVGVIAAEREGAALALVFDDLQGTAAGQFTGGLLLAILRDVDGGVGAAGDAHFELRRFDAVAPIPAPAAAPLMLAALSALALARGRRGEGRLRPGPGGRS